MILKPIAGALFAMVATVQGQGLPLSSTTATVCSARGNVLVDPGFELQTPPEQGGWMLGGGVFADVSSGGYARSGQHSMYDSAYYSGAGPGERLPAAPGSQWQLTGYAFHPYPLFGGPAFGILQVTFVDINGADLGTVETTGNQYPAKTSAAMAAGTSERQWTFLDVGIATAPAGTAAIGAFALYIDFSGYFGQSVYFDDLNLQVLGVTHGGYVSSIARNAETLRRAGLITRAQQEAMVETAAHSNGGKQTDCAADH